MNIVSRAEWGARHDNGAGAAPLPATEVWLHHSVTAAANGPGIIRELEQIGENRFGTGISYTWPITPDGTVYEGHSVNRMGTHTGGRNSKARAVCFVGNYETGRPTEAQIRSAAWLLQYAHANGWIDAPRLDGGHRDLKATACPGKHAYAVISRINELAAGPPITEEEDMGHVDSISEQVLAQIAQRTADQTLWRDSDPDPVEDVPIWGAINGIRDQVDVIKAVLDGLAASVAELKTRLEGSTT